MKAILQFHTSYVMSSPKCEELMSSIYSMIESKTKNYNKILQLRGKLDLMVQQMNTEPETDEQVPEASKEALLVYHDDSDELNEGLDEILLPVSDTDNEDWEQDQESEQDSNESNEKVIDVEDSDEEEGSDDADENDDNDDDDDDQDMDVGEPQTNGVDGSSSEDEE